MESGTSKTLAPLGRGPVLIACWITAVVLAPSLFSSSPIIENYLKPAFFLGLLVFFVALGRTEPGLRSLPFRMLEIGFLLLFTGTTLGAVFRTQEVPGISEEFLNQLAFICDRGLGLMLGLSLISYGIVLWVPEILQAQQMLKMDLEIARDTERRKGEALRKASDLLKRQDALVTAGELAAGVAHELRNPLAILKSAVQTFREECLSETERSHCLGVMERALEKADRRISGLLDLGRDKPFHPALGSAVDLLEKARDLACIEARSDRVSIEILGAGREDLFFGDPELLLQVLINLLRNAVQASQEGGRIRLVYEGIPGGTGACRILVEDRGTGIPEEVLPKLSRPFFTTKKGGTGLGLALSAQILDQHGGRFHIGNRKGGGTRVEIELPGKDLSRKVEPCLR